VRLNSHKVGAADNIEILLLSSLFFLSIEPSPGKLAMQKIQKSPNGSITCGCKAIRLKTWGQQKRMRQNCSQKMSEESNQDSRFFRQFSAEYFCATDIHLA